MFKIIAITLVFLVVKAIQLTSSLALSYSLDGDAGKEVLFASLLLITAMAFVTVVTRIVVPLRKYVHQSLMVVAIGGIFLYSNWLVIILSGIFLWAMVNAEAQALTALSNSGKIPPVFFYVFALFPLGVGGGVDQLTVMGPQFFYAITSLLALLGSYIPPVAEEKQFIAIKSEDPPFIVGVLLVIASCIIYYPLTFSEIGVEVSLLALIVTFYACGITIMYISLGAYIKRNYTGGVTEGQVGVV